MYLNLMLFAEHHPQLSFSWRWDGPLSVCAADGPSEPPGDPYEDASGLLQPGLLEFSIFIWFLSCSAHLYFSHTHFSGILQEQRDMLHGLRQAAFEMESESGLSNERRRSLCAKEFKKLGFSVSTTKKCFRVKVWILHHNKPQSLNSSVCVHQNNSNPGQDLSRCPPGLLALDTMAYFASRYPDAYSRVSEPNWILLSYAEK